ncbi:hypothetical protein GGF46_004776 [Coemansia sp. RSA 552]|nr:hypothetical protein GGF46_004776 [Coemansia sp. RSA 552]
MGMGTGLALPSSDTEAQGVVPRAIGEIWSQLEKRVQSQAGFSYSVDVSFLELYNEDLIDLLNPKAAGGNGGRGPAIREDSRGNMVLVGVERQTASYCDDVVRYLHQGALSRTTASTDMNRTSSRSHAIFTVHLRQQDRRSSVIPTGDLPPAGAEPVPGRDGGTSIVSKIHFVDLAGSERIKRTGAAGDRAKEGISINAGLLALGNVISALGSSAGGGSQKRFLHVPYRDSKLTRLLQDSLGGNSQTLMLACISPSDKNSPESLNTIRYANRARNIRNKVAVNFDKNSSVELSMLKTEVARLRGELSKLKLQRRQSSMALGSGDLPPEVTNLAEIDRLQIRNADLTKQLNAALRRTAVLERERDSLRAKISGLGGSVHSTPALSEAALPEQIEPEEKAEALSTRPNSLFDESDVLSRSNVMETIDRELSVQAERHEHQIGSVRRHYESKLELVQETLAIIQKERDVALHRLANAPKAAEATPGAKPGSGANSSAAARQTLGIDSAQGPVEPTRLRLPSRMAKGQQSRPSTPLSNRSATMDTRGNSRPTPPPMPRFVTSQGIGASSTRDERQLERLQDDVARLRAENQSLNRQANADSERMTLQIQEQAQEISRLRRQRTGRRESHRLSLLSFKENSWGLAKSAQQQPTNGTNGGPKLLRAAFIKAVLESEFQRCVRARQLLRERDSFLNKQDRLMNEQNDLLLQMQNPDLEYGDDVEIAQQLDKVKDHIEIIDAELHYLDLKVRDIEAEIAQLAETTADQDRTDELTNSGLKMTPAIINLSGLAMRMVEDVVRIDYSAFADLFVNLPQADSTGLAYLLMQDIIEHRLVALRDEQERTKLEEQLMGSRRTLLAMQRTALNASLTYERELGDAERRLNTLQSPASEGPPLTADALLATTGDMALTNGSEIMLASATTDVSPDGSFGSAISDTAPDRSVYEGVRDRGILLRSALMSALESEPEPSDILSPSLHSPASNGSLRELEGVKMPVVEYPDSDDSGLPKIGADTGGFGGDARGVSERTELVADAYDDNSYMGSLGVSGLQGSHMRAGIDPSRSLDLSTSIVSISQPELSEMAGSPEQMLGSTTDSRSYHLHTHAFEAESPDPSMVDSGRPSTSSGMTSHQPYRLRALSDACPAYTDADDDSKDYDGEEGPEPFFSDPEENDIESEEEDGEIPELYHSGAGEVFRIPNLARKQSVRRRRHLVRRMSLRRRMGKVPGAGPAVRRTGKRKGSIRRPRISLPIVPQEMIDYVDTRNPSALHVGNMQPLVASPELFRKMRIPAVDGYQKSIAAFKEANADTDPAAALASGEVTPELARTTKTPVPSEVASQESARDTDSGVSNVAAFTPRSAGKVLLHSHTDGSISAELSRETLDNSSSNLTRSPCAPRAPQQISVTTRSPSPLLHSPVGSSETAVSPQSPAAPLSRLRSPTSFYNKTTMYSQPGGQKSYKSVAGERAYRPPNMDIRMAMAVSPDERVPATAPIVSRPYSVVADSHGLPLGMVREAPLSETSSDSTTGVPESQFLSPTKRANASLFTMMDAAQADAAMLSQAHDISSTASPVSVQKKVSTDESIREGKHGIVAKPSRIRRRAQSTLDNLHQRRRSVFSSDIAKTPDVERPVSSSRRFSRLLSGIGLGGHKQPKSPGVPMMQTGIVSSSEVYRDRSASESVGSQIPHVRKVHSTVYDGNHAQQHWNAGGVDDNGARPAASGGQQWRNAVSFDYPRTSRIPPPWASPNTMPSEYTGNGADYPPFRP